jgi:HEAT repeat protein
MIEEEIMDIIGESDDKGSRFNRLADEFRRERDPRELLDLLDSTNEDLVAAGVWILEEIPLSRYNSTHFIERLMRLINHKSAMVRFYAVGALFPALDAASTNLIESLQDDPNEGVRKKAKAAIEKIESAK